MAFFPMLLPLLLGVFPCFSENEESLSTYFSALLVCFGAGTVITGCLLFSNQSAFFLFGRISTIGWMCLMIPLLINVSSFARRRETTEVVRDMIFDREYEEKQFVFTETELFPMQYVSEETMDDADDPPRMFTDRDRPVQEQKTELREYDSLEKQTNVNETVGDFSEVFLKQPCEQPISLATRKQLEYFRERIATSRVFDKTEEKSKRTGQQAFFIEEPETAHEPATHVVGENPREKPGNMPDFVVPGKRIVDEMINTPAFPNVWSVGTKYRSRNVVSESQATTGHAAVSLGKRHVAESNLIKLTSYASRPENTNPDILPMPPRHDSDRYDKRNPRKAI